VKRHTLAPLPLATATLAVAMSAVYGLELALGDPIRFCGVYGFTASAPSLGTVLTSTLLHDPQNVLHVAGNLLMLVVLGAVVEPALGRFRFVALFVAAGISGCAFHWLVAPGSDVPLVGMSGSLCGLMAVASIVRPRAILGFVGTYIAINLLALFVSTPLVPPGTSVACHLGGFALGAFVVVAARLRGVDLRHRARRVVLAGAM
jgi:membrane associated rhomboid family serine protease